jgi:hypothetical protein
VGQAIGQILSLAVGVAISPIPIIGVVLMLVTPRARANGPAFVLGWLIGLGIVGAIVLLVAPSGTSDSGGPATWVSTLKLVLGALLVLMAAKQWRGRPHGDEQAATPKWMGAIDGFNAPKAFGAGAVLGDRAGPILERLKSWLAQNNGVIMAVLLLIIGVKLIGDAITGFSS